MQYTRFRDLVFRELAVKKCQACPMDSGYTKNDTQCDGGYV